MKYYINLKAIILVFRYSIIWFILYIICVLYLDSHETHWALRFSSIIFGLFLLPLFVLFVQYVLHSLKRVNVKDRHIYFEKKNADFSAVQIEKYQSTNKPDNNAAYLPWMAGTFYYYKISVGNKKTYYVTCLMDRKRYSFEQSIGDLGIDISLKNEFYPWIR